MKKDLDLYSSLQFAFIKQYHVMYVKLFELYYYYKHIFKYIIIIYDYVYYLQQTNSGNNV